MKLKFPYLIDGGLSNVLEAQGCDLNHPLWTANLLENNPEAIIQAHYAYLEAGAACITTASYQASVPGFKQLGLDEQQAKALILKSIDLANEAINRAGKNRLWTQRPHIAASIGPYGAYLADGSEYRGNYGVDLEVLHTFHESRIRLLDTAPVDFLACETIPSIEEAKVLAKILEQVQTPAWVSFSCRDGQSLNDGTPIARVAEVFTKHPTVFALGVNCSHPKYISSLIKNLKSKSGSKKIVIYPNSGEAYNAQTKTWLGTADPDAFLKMVEEWLDLGADMIGGCCRIGPKHIKGIRESLNS